MDSYEEMNVDPVIHLDPQWDAFSSWLETLTYGDAFVTPMRTMWANYKAYCTEWGFPLAEPAKFVWWIGELDGLTVKTGGKGRIRRVLLGATIGR